MRCQAIAVLLVLGAAATHGDPVFSYVSRFSFVQIYGELPDAPPPQDYYSDARSATHFGLFDRTITDEISWGGVRAMSEASQTSNLGPTLVTATAWTYADLSSATGVGSGRARANSEFEVVFELASPAPVELSGAVHTPPGCGPPTPYCEVQLSHQVGTAWVERYHAEFESPLAFTATLDSGRYRLSAQSYIAADTAFGTLPIHGSTSFDLSLRIVPEPAGWVLLLVLTAARRR